jgi:uncharacterized protein (DUF849 family)
MIIKQVEAINLIRAANVNAPEAIRRPAERMKERRIKPEPEIFDYGMADSFFRKTPAGNGYSAA